MLKKTYQYFSLFLTLKCVINLSVIADESLEDITEHHVETITDNENHILVRSRRSENAGEKIFIKVNLPIFLNSRPVYV